MSDFITATMENIKEKNGLIILFMSGFRCPPCQNLKKILLANDKLKLNNFLQKIEENINEKVHFLINDVQKGHLPHWIEKSNLRSIPTFVLIKNNEYFGQFQPTKYLNDFSLLAQEIAAQFRMYNA